MNVYEFMSTKIDEIEGDKTLYDAVEVMVNKRIRALVVRNPHGKPDRSAIGVLTARDIVFKVLAKGVNPKLVKVSDIASIPITCADKNTKVQEAASLMEKCNIARLFVCDGEKVVGVLSLLDVMAAELVMIARGNNDS